MPHRRNSQVLTHRPIFSHPQLPQLGSVQPALLDEVAPEESQDATNPGGLSPWRKWRFRQGKSSSHSVKSHVKYGDL